ncbi:phage integrase central domain-containing protein [Caballeronia catudaia]|uniref:phage integrase central domain-containing protein n=1 Tax=Caballeronia catudaia TaxID=1777136 RepID=UPI001F274F9A|nr:hypothetical protein [Caballeronia catudaia]
MEKRLAGRKTCVDVLQPIWLEKRETASRVRQRMHAVMQWAWAHGHIAANPVGVVDHILPKQTGRKKHQPATPSRDLPAFIKTHVVEFKRRSHTRRLALFDSDGGAKRRSARRDLG